jgi:hypothetical protein
VSTWSLVVGGAFLLTGAVLAIATTTSNKLRWAVLAPSCWGTGLLLIAVVNRDWGPVAVGVGMLFYAAINYRNLVKGKA